MVMPASYWMLECTGCGARRVVLDTGNGREHVVSPDPEAPPGSGYTGRFVTERYACANQCDQPMLDLGSISCVDEKQEMKLPMRLQREPLDRVKLTKAQSDEWRQLIEAAGLPARWEKPRWRFW